MNKVCLRDVPSTATVWPVQVERIAAIEPVQLEVPGISELATRLKAAVAKPAGEVVQSARRKQMSAGQQRSLPSQADAGETGD